MLRSETCPKCGRSLCDPINPEAVYYNCWRCVTMVARTSRKVQSNLNLRYIWNNVETPAVLVGSLLLTFLLYRKFGWKKVMVVSGIIMAVSIWEASSDDLEEMD